MRRALRLAARGRGLTSPNPMVGATVIAADGTIVGDGWHQRAGTPHAEVHALDQAGARSRGATLVCTLEPCCHQGRTGPCVERIIAAGITHVVAATEDPNPLVAGGGFRRLEQAGVRVTVGVGADAARQLNRAFITVMREGRPWVIFKAGVSIDGMIAAAPGRRTQITSPPATAQTQRLRAEVDALAVGSGTVLVDDPLLTARDVYRSRALVRAVFDRRLRTPPSSRLFSTGRHGPVILLVEAASLRLAGPQVSALEGAGAQVEATDGTLAGGFRRLAELGVQSVLLEGGARLQQAAWDAGMIDEVRLFVAPEPIGPGGVPLFPDGGPSISALSDVRTVPTGPDVLITGYVHRPH
jgi:diaminohydroxyphosphoribosylaminopyrimidine deaminase/5-amino-6-(5-phosphoribosylamino)uracil reductase